MKWTNPLKGTLMMVNGVALSPQGIMTTKCFIAGGHSIQIVFRPIIRT